jgi:GNAT superfamily N-acetyltransferase
MFSRASTLGIVPASVRSADPGDVEAVAHVHAVSRRAYYEAGGVLIPPLNPDAIDEYLTFWSETLIGETNRAWVAESCGECVGFLVAGAPIHDDVLGQLVLELIGLYVVPEAWGTRIADELHGRFIEVLKDTRLDGALDVWRGNGRAMAFYRRHGWSPDGRSRPGPGDQPFLGLRISMPSLDV